MQVLREGVDIARGHKVGSSTSSGGIWKVSFYLGVHQLAEERACRHLRAYADLCGPCMPVPPDRDGAAFDVGAATVGETFMGVANRGLWGVPFGHKGDPLLIPLLSHW